MDTTVTRWDRSAADCPGMPVAEPWPTASPAEAGIDAGALAAIAERVERGELRNVHSLLVVRGGKLVFERYFAGDDAVWGRSLGRVSFGPDTLHDLRSVTKSVVGALVGIAHGDGALPDLDAPLASVLPEQSKGRERELAGRTVRHALTMSAGLEWDELSHPYWDPRNDENGMWRSRDPVAYALARPVVAVPGTRFAYNGGLPTVLAAAVEKTTGMPIDRFARERLWCPLGITQVEWVRHGSGVFVAASGLRLRPRDMARFGWMMLDGGRFGGRQIVPADYARVSLEPQMSTANPIAENYGYLWWLARVPTETGGVDLPVALGNGGQRIVVDRPAGVVIVITAGNYDARDQGEVPRDITRAVLRAVDRPS